MNVLNFTQKPKQELIFEDAVLAHDKTIMDLFLSFSHVMAEKQRELKNSHTVVERDDYRIEDMMTVISERLSQSKKTCFEQDFTKNVNLFQR